MTPARGLVLMYHRIGPALLAEEGDYVTEIEHFGAQIQVLAKSGRPVLPLARLLDPGFPDGALWLSFDDGRESDAVLATPLLREAGFPAAFFVNPGLVGDRSRGNMGWAQLRALADAGFEVGSHGLDHTLFGDLPSAELEQQIVDSKRRLEDELGRAVRALALPGGSGGERARRLAEAAGYEIVLGSQPGRVQAKDRGGIVPRFAMREWHSPGRLRALLQAGPLIWLSYSLRYQATHRGRHLLGERAYGRLRLLFLALREGRASR
jgi:peptidoglycan/xylan/chitin deacetylase (PgdA/CDA1 family)